MGGISTAPPGQPHNIACESIGATWIHISWDPPVMADSLISHYEITARTDIAMVTVITANNNTFFNITGLLPGTTYDLTVVAVSQGGDVIARSQESEPVQGIITGVTGVYTNLLVCGVRVYKRFRRSSSCLYLLHSSSTYTQFLLSCVMLQSLLEVTS